MMWTVITIALVLIALVALIGLWIERDADRYPSMDASPTDWHNAIEREFAAHDDRRGPVREWGKL